MCCCFELRCVELAIIVIKWESSKWHMCRLNFVVITLTDLRSLSLSRIAFLCASSLAITFSVQQKGEEEEEEEKEKVRKRVAT